MQGLMVTILLVGVLNACQEEQQENQQNLIDYHELPEINFIQIREIGENENFLPGKLNDLLVFGNGDLIVTDVSKKTIEQFNADGKYMGTVAREGKGPGDLHFFFEIFATDDEAFGVWTNSNRQLDLFRVGQNGIYTYQGSKTSDVNLSRRFDIIGTHTESNFLVITGQTDADYISTNNPEYRFSPVSVADEYLSIVRDSLHMIKYPNYIFANSTEYSSAVTIGNSNLALLGIPPYRYRDRIVVLNNGTYMIARPDSSMLWVYSSNHEIVEQIPLKVKARNVKKADLDHAFRNNDLTKQPKVRKKLASYVEEKKPPFLNIWASGDYILLQTDVTEGGKEMVILTMGGKPLGKFILPEYDEIKQFTDDYLYAINKDPMGHSIRVYQLLL
jgi:hypothetical protein